MWIFYLCFYIILSIVFTQLYKMVAKDTKNAGALTVLLQLIAGVSIFCLSIFFPYSFPKDIRVYLLLGLACIFYSISDRVNTTVRGGIEASTFSIINQLSTVFMVFAGVLFFKEEIVLKKIIGAVLIIISNVLIFYKKGKNRMDKYVFLGILANVAYSIALFLDVNISSHFNLAMYVATTLLVSALFITVVEHVKIRDIKKEFERGNHVFILFTGLSWSSMIFCQLRAYQVGEVTTVAPLCALTVIGNVLFGYFFLKERDDLVKKVVAGIIILISVFLIKG